MNSIPNSVLLKAVALLVAGSVFGTLAIWVGESEDAPGAMLIGFLAVIASGILAAWTVRKSHK